MILDKKAKHTNMNVHVKMNKKTTKKPKKSFINFNYY